MVLSSIPAGGDGLTTTYKENPIAVRIVIAYKTTSKLLAHPYILASEGEEKDVGATASPRCQETAKRVVDI